MQFYARNKAKEKPHLIDEISQHEVYKCLLIYDEFEEFSRNNLKQIVKGKEIKLDCRSYKS